MWIGLSDEKLNNFIRGCLCFFIKNEKNIV